MREYGKPIDEVIGLPLEIIRLQKFRYREDPVGESGGRQKIDRLRPGVAEVELVRPPPGQQDRGDAAPAAAVVQPPPFGPGEGAGPVQRRHEAQGGSSSARCRGSRCISSAAPPAAIAGAVPGRRPGRGAPPRRAAPAGTARRGIAGADPAVVQVVVPARHALQQRRGQELVLREGLGLVRLEAMGLDRPVKGEAPRPGIVDLAQLPEGVDAGKIGGRQPEAALDRGQARVQRDSRPC